MPETWVQFLHHKKIKIKIKKHRFIFIENVFEPICNKSYNYLKTETFSKFKSDMMAHTSNPNHSRSRHWEKSQFENSPGKKLTRLHLKFAGCVSHSMTL
jgi:hypothetical protein